MNWIQLNLLFVIAWHAFKGTDPTIETARNKLISSKTLSYSIKELTIEGKLRGDTIFTSTICTFEKSPNDSLIGYNYFTESNLIHPRFKVPMTSSIYYNGENHFWGLKSEVKNDNVITPKADLTAEKLENDVYGQLPTLVKILSLNGFSFRSSKDTAIDRIPCTCISTISSTNIPYDLFIDKKTKFPKLLRITENKVQPFIREYYYSNFNRSTSLQEPSFINRTWAKTVEDVPLTVGDTFPELKLQTVDGNHFSFEENKGKVSILFLSAINCGWCQKLIPAIQRVFDKYKRTGDIRCLVFYPADSKEKLADYIKSKGIDYPVLFNPSEDPKERYWLNKRIANGYPTTIILNRKNEIIWIKTGFSEELEKEIEKRIKQE